MSTMIEAPISMVQAVADLHLPPKADQRMQDLMDRNNNGALAPEQGEELETLAELRSPKYLRNLVLCNPLGVVRQIPLRSSKFLLGGPGKFLL